MFAQPVPCSDLSEVAQQMGVPIVKIKTDELTGPALDWAVAVTLGMHPTMRHDHMRKKAAANNYRGDLEWQLEVQHNDPITVDEDGATHVIPWFSVLWSQVGPIIERESLSVAPAAGQGWRSYSTHNKERKYHVYADGPTPLIAICRCFVASKMGDEVDVPDELVKEMQR